MLTILSIFLLLLAVYLWSLSQIICQLFPKIISAYIVRHQKAVTPFPSLNLRLSLPNTTVLQTLVTRSTDSALNKYRGTSQNNTQLSKHKETPELKNIIVKLSKRREKPELKNIIVKLSKRRETQELKNIKVSKHTETPELKNIQVSKHIETPKLLCMYFRDRLGNQMFQYASTLGLSLTLNRVPVFLNGQILQEVLDNFTVSSANLSFSQLEERCAQAEVIQEARICAYDERLTWPLDPRYDYTLGYWLQSYMYFDKYESKIRKAITFTKKIRKQSENIVQELRQKYPGCTLIGVHIRRGDMAEPDNRERGYPLASPGFIKRSSSYFTQRYSSCVFVVASDSLQWCRYNFPKGYTLHFLAGNEPAVDLNTLVLTDHVVTSFGTFSWWIGYLNRGTTVYMKDFLIQNTQVASYFGPDPAKDYVYPGWIPL